MFMKLEIIAISAFLFATLSAAPQIELMQDQPGSQTISLQVGEIQINPEQGFSRLQMDDAGYHQTEGLPEIPRISFLFEVDPYTEYEFSMTVLQSHTVEDILLFPVQPQNSTSLLQDEDFYQTAVDYPAERLQVSERQTMRGVEIVTVLVTPFRYNPAARVLTVYDEVDVNVTEIGPRSERMSHEMPASRTFDQLYSSLIINYNPDRPAEDYQTPCVLYICGGSSESHYYTQQLLEWRERRGYEVHSVSTSETGSSTSNIKSYIQNAYNTWSNPPEIVGLIGDVGGSFNIPTYTEYWSGYYGDGDHPYSQLDGNDILPEVLIGRISVNNSTELSLVIDKTLNYEKANFMENNWFERAALVGDPSSSGISTWISNAYIANIMENYGMEDVRTNLGQGNYESWMENQLAEGLLYFNYRGYIGTSGFDANDINSVNNGYMTPFCTFITCGTGSFSGTALSESFLRAGTMSNPKGGVAAIGTSTLGTHTMFNNIVDMGFYDGLFSKGVETAGGALASGKLALYHTYPDDPADRVSIFTHWNNLMGDPALYLWTDTPIIQTVMYPNEISIGTNFIDVLVLSDTVSPIEGAVVTLINNSESIHLSVLTDEMGLATIMLPTDVSGDVDIIVTCRNVKPHEGTFTITDNGPSVNILADGIIVNDAAGNGNGFLNPGESVQLDIPVQNFGSETASGLVISLISGTEQAVVLNEPAEVEALNPDEVYHFMPELSLESNVIWGTDLDLRVELISEEDEVWSGVAPLNPEAAWILVDHLTIEGGALYPGTTGAFQVAVTNAGSMDLTDLSISAFFAGSMLEISDEPTSIDVIHPHETVTAEGSFTVTADGDIINGSVFNLDFRIATPDGYDQVVGHSIEIGISGSGDPVGPDAYGYYIYDSEDTNYNLAPVYDWIEIDPGYGGSGISLNLDDDGNGHPTNTTPAYINLPFPFTFYGVDYNEVTVCANGWISFGHSVMVSFRNYPVPGAGGPSPMVAAFWDDLETNSGGQVYYEIDAVNGRVIIQWGDMRTHDENDVETFQIILYDTMTPTGDDEIKIQYKEVNNTTTGNYSSYTPIHGCYSTVGIENHLGTVGLQYSFDNQYPVSAAELSDGLALFITTRLPEALPHPALAYGPDQFDVTISDEMIYSGSMDIENIGEEGSLLYYSISKSPFSVPGPSDVFGHHWNDTDMNQDFGFEWIDISEDGTQLEFDHNDTAADPIDIGFEFPFFDSLYTQCIVNPNGWIGFGEDENTWQNIGIPSYNAPGPALMPFWDDLNPVNNANSNAMEGYVYYHSTPERLVVWFDHVAHWSGEIDGNYDFQAVLYPNGEFQYSYSDLEGRIDRCTIGFQNGDGTDGIQVVHDNDYVHENLTVKFKTAPDWLNMTPSSGTLFGEIPEGESVTLYLSVDGNGMMAGVYESFILLSSNAGPTQLIPFNITIDPVFTIIPGDLNSDEEVNVLDVVSLVEIIVDQLTPSNEVFLAADVNEDGLLDVIDIVIIVNMIIGE